LEDAFEASENDKTLPFSIIVDDTEFNFTIAFFKNGGLGINILEEFRNI
jgi:hypothetical protein